MERKKLNLGCGKLIMKGYVNLDFLKLDGVDVVIHLAAMSNDPSAELNPQITRVQSTFKTRSMSTSIEWKLGRY